MCNLFLKLQMYAMENATTIIKYAGFQLVVLYIIEMVFTIDAKCSLKQQKTSVNTFK